LFFREQDIVNGPFLLDKDEKKKFYAKKKIDKNILVTSIAALSH
jgi:hypothetical protein